MTVGNASSATQTITIIDTTSPVFTSVPADYTAECSDEHPMDEATATDNCGEVVITVEEVTTAGACAGDYVITVRSLLLMTVVTQQRYSDYHYHRHYVSSLHFSSS